MTKLANNIHFLKITALGHSNHSCEVRVRTYLYTSHNLSLELFHEIRIS
jgi:hypothetical protein